MFQNQRSALAASLRAAGLPASAATLIANILSNPQATLRVGPMQQDTTPRNMRQVTPSDRLTLPGLDFRQADPYHVNPRTQESEEKKTAEQESNVKEESPPQAVLFAHNVDSGAFITATPAGESSAVSLNIKGANNGLVTVNAPDNSLLSRSFRASSDANGIRLDIEKNNKEVVWKLLFDKQNADFIDVVTDVRLENNAIVLSKARIYPLSFELLDDVDAITVAECP